MPTNPLVIVHNGIWDPVVDVFKGCVSPKESKLSHYDKVKIMESIFPLLNSEHEKNLDNGVEPLTSFIMAEKLHAEHEKMKKEREDDKESHKNAKALLTESMKFLES